MNKICVYTAITGNYDDILEIDNKEKGIDYYLFTDNENIKSKTWKVIYVKKDDNLTEAIFSRKLKTLGYPEITDKYDILLWQDASVKWNSKILDFIHKYLKDKDNFVGFRHGLRENITQEAIECIKVNKENLKNVNKLFNFYKQENYINDNGLLEATVFIRRNNEIVKKTMELWFYMISNYSGRDQLSFPYCIKKTGLKVKWINKYVFDNEYFKCFNHKKLKNNKEIKTYFVNFNDEGEYNFNLIKQDDYTIKDNIYTIKFKVPDNSNRAVIYVEHLRGIYLNSVIFNNKSIKEYNHIIYNVVEYEDRLVFYDDMPIIVINKKFKKGEKFELKLNLEKLNNDDIYKLVEYLSINTIEDDIYYKKEINEKDQEIKFLKDNYNNILNSTSWKITKPLRKISSLFRKSN